MDSKAPTSRILIPPDVGTPIVLLAASLGFFAGNLVLFLASGLMSWLAQRLTPYLAAATEATAATHPVVGLLHSLLLCGMFGAFLISLLWNAARVGVTVYRKTVTALLRWHLRRTKPIDFEPNNA